MSLVWWLLAGCVEVEVDEACVSADGLALDGLALAGVEALVTIEERLHSGPVELPGGVDVALVLLDGHLVAEVGDFGFAERVELTIDDGRTSTDVLCYDRAVQGPATTRLDLVAEPAVLDGLFGSDEVTVDLRLTVRTEAIPASFAYASEVCLAGAASLDVVGSLTAARTAVSWTMVP